MNQGTKKEKKSGSTECLKKLSLEPIEVVLKVIFLDAL